MAATKTAPDRILLIPEGDVGLTGSKDFHFDAEQAATAIAFFNRRGVDIPIDYEHHSVGGVFAAPDGRAAAAGWITSMEYVEGEGLYVAARWTDTGRRYLETAEYRYFSPVIVWENKDTRKVRWIPSVALTNTPKIEQQGALVAASLAPVELQLMEIEPMADKKNRRKTRLPTDPPSGLRQLAGRLDDGAILVAKDDSTEFAAVEDEMALVAELISTLNAAGASLPDDAPIADVLQAALDALAAAPEAEEASEEAEAKATAELSAQLGVKGDKLATEIASLKVQAGRTPELEKRLAVLEEERGNERVDSLIAGMVEANKINPNDEKDVAACRDLAKRDPEQFEVLVGKRAPYAEPGELTGGKDVGATPTGARGKLIAEACKEFDADPKVAFGADKANYIAGALACEQMDTVLTDTELATVKGGAE